MSTTRTQISFVGVVISFLLAWSASFATAAGIELTVHGGGHDRTNVPVTARVELPKEVKSAASVELTLPDGKTIPAELTTVGICTGAADSTNRKLQAAR